MDRGAWEAAVHRLAQSWTQPKRYGKVYQLGKQAQYLMVYFAE